MNIDNDWQFKAEHWERECKRRIVAGELLKTELLLLQSENTRLQAASDRYLAAVGRLSETSGYNKLTYFEAPISKMPTVEMGEDAAARWIELNNAGRALAAAIRTQDDEVEESDEYGRLARHRDDFDDDAGQFPTR